MLIRIFFMAEHCVLPIQRPHRLTAQPILTHERSLTKKVAKGSGSRDIYDQQILMLGAQLVTQVSILIKMSRLHGRTSTALDNPIECIDGDQDIGL
jgi:hypothetical protein